MSQPSAISTETSAVYLANRRVVITLYTVSVFLFWMAQYIYLPTLPAFAQFKVNDFAVVGFILSMYGLWQAIVRLPLGIASDWLGWHKPFLIVGLALSGVGAWIMGTANDANALIIGRAITGASAGTWAVVIVAFSALFPGREAIRATVLLTLINTLGRIIATAVTGVLTDWGGYAMPFYVATIIGLLSAIMILPIDEPHREKKSPSITQIGKVLRRRDVLAPTLLNTVMQYSLWTTSFGFFSLLAKQLGANNILQSAIVTVHLVFVVVGNTFTSRYLRRIGNTPLVVASFLFTFAGTLAAAFATTLETLFIAPVFVGIGLGIGYPVLMGMSIERVSAPERTIAMGLHQAIYAIGMFVGPALSGYLADRIGLQPMFGITGFACLALGLFGSRYLKTKSNVPEIPMEGS